jgi:penicillin-binding protein 1A
VRRILPLLKTAARWVPAILICLVLALPAAVLGLFVGFSGTLPSVDELRAYNPGLMTRLYDINDNLLTSFYLERREIVPMEGIPEYLKNAVIAVEDARFLTHRGVDPWGIARALFRNVFAGEVVQGGSTITQQVARAIFLSPERKLTRKIKEAILSWRLERQFTKRDILWLYLNHIYFGEGAYGVEAASRAYFGRKVSSLGLAECALLAALPKAPSHYSPFVHPEAAQARMKHVLDRMTAEKYITPEQAREALARALVFQARQEGDTRAPFFTEHVRRYLEAQYGADLLYKGGLHVYTTLDPRLQAAAEGAVQGGVREVDKRRGYYEDAVTRIDLARPGAIQEAIRGMKDWPGALKEGDIYPGIVLSTDDPKRAVVRVGPAEGLLPLKGMDWVYRPSYDLPDMVGEMLHRGDVIRVRVESLGNLGRPLLALEQDPRVEGALIALNPRDGEVLAMVGGFDFGRNQFNRAVQSRRQPGSAFKPFIYAAAIEKGYSPADIIIDSPVVLRELKEDATVKKWKPENYDEKFYGALRLRDALNRSINLVTIKLLKKIGLRPVLDLAGRLGIRSPLTRDLSLALGTSGVTLMELTAAYGAIANEGIYTPPMFVRYITDRKGTLLEVHQPRPRRAMDRDAAYVISNMLRTVVEDGTGKAARVLNRPAAGKTGTTNDFMDAWFLGFTPQIVTGVWVGLDAEKKIGPQETGSRAALPVWISFMEKALAGMPVEEFPIPPGVVFTRVDAATGLLAAPESKEAMFEVFRKGTEPRVMARPAAKSATDFMRMDLDGQ